MSAIPTATLIPLNSEMIATPTRKPKKWPAVHPWMLAIFPVFTIWAGNIREVSVAEVLLTTLVVGGLTTCVTLGLRFLLGSWTKSSLATSLILLTLLGFSYLSPVSTFTLALTGSRRMGAAAQTCVWLSGVAGILWWTSRTKTDMAKWTSLANTFAVGLGAFSLFMLTSAMAVSPWLRAPSDPQLVPPAADMTLSDKSKRPDIFYLVFDRYGDEQTLSNEFGHDNSGFLDQLRERGFFIAEESCANYPKTELSMASALNMTYHGERVWPKVCYRELLQDHLVGRLLKQQGYQYFHFGNKHTGLRRNRNADFNFRFSAMPTEMSENVFRMTPGYSWWSTLSPAEQALGKLAGVAQAAQQPGKKFVYAHFMLPHEPWKFDADGSLLTEAEASQRTETENYAAQLAYTNQRIVQLVDAINAACEQPPIIVIQADEGPELRYEGDENKSEVAKLRKRCGIISAFQLPGADIETIVSPRITPVNTFRLVFREYFDAPIELHEDRTFYWDHVDPMGKPDLTQDCRFVDVTHKIRQP